MLKTKDLLNQSLEEVEAQYEDLCREIFELMNELKLTRKLDKPHLIREKKRDRARVLTILRQRNMKGV